MSALPPKADIDGRRSDVRFVPTADIDHLHSITSSARPRSGSAAVEAQLACGGVSSWTLGIKFFAAQDCRPNWDGLFNRDRADRR
jgi:hypothetical protein